MKAEWHGQCGENQPFFCHLVPGITISKVQGEIRLVNYKKITEDTARTAKLGND